MVFLLRLTPLAEPRTPQLLGASLSPVNLIVPHSGTDFLTGSLSLSSFCACVWPFYARALLCTDTLFAVVTTP